MNHIDEIIDSVRERATQFTTLLTLAGLDDECKMTPWNANDVMALEYAQRAIACEITSAHANLAADVAFEAAGTLLSECANARNHAGYALWRVAETVTKDNVNTLSRVIVDGGFDCLDPYSTHTVIHVNNGLCIHCKDGLHYLDGQLAKDGTYIGIGKLR